MKKISRIKTHCTSINKLFTIILVFHQVSEKACLFNFLESHTVPACHFQLAGLVGLVKAQCKVVGRMRSVNQKVMQITS